ncbi:PadR family transcriptional regulator [Actinocrispum sp. NPDC049592]|uniref:PadR family transcriptional regulator n=1 Tax=Actinocrispum sp. NPDC049592 TaxID=3154835 RepID=UPI00343C66F3
MAKRRKVGNLLALAVLGTLVQRPMHPYEMASFLRERGKDDDMPIKWGSLYTVVQNLEKHGFIEATGSTRAGGRPERTTYAITDGGREELQDWVRELLGTPEREPLKFTAALSMIGALPPDEAIGLLRQRRDLLTARIAADEQQYESTRQSVPRMFLIEQEYELAVWRAEIQWIDGLLADFGSGAFPELDGWRAFYQTGTVPPEFRDLAERGAPAE